ncbi:MAG: HAMP domain-containing sensor histidine kinase [Pseudomonadota bacterium]|nr:HAMP domain-containing sensor histidine kinase [Pseudomonadota bacterium]
MGEWENTRDEPSGVTASVLARRLRAADDEVRQLRRVLRLNDVRHGLAMAACRGAPFAELAALALARLEPVIPLREARVTLLEGDGGTAVGPHSASGGCGVHYAPIAVDEKVVGFLELYRDGGGVFLADEVALAADVADLLAHALVREQVTRQEASHARALEARHALGRAELDRTQEQLIQAAKLSSIGELAAGLVHELNQPLNVLGGYVELLSEGALAPPAQGRALDVMTRAVERMTSMVDNLRNFARSGGPTMSPVDVGEVLTMARELTVGAMSHNVALTCPRGLVVSGDANRLEQVFVNLLANALQTGGDPVTVTVVAPDAECVVVEFRDRGPGVPEALRERIFEPFFTTKPVSKGTGLGLSVSARIVRDHGGRIDVSENPGGGALFRVTLPRVRGAGAGAVV